MSDSEGEAQKNAQNPFSQQQDDPNMPFAPQKPAPDYIQEEQKKAEERREKEIAEKKAAKKQMHVTRAENAKTDPDAYVQVSTGSSDFFVDRHIAETCDPWRAAIDFKARNHQVTDGCVKIEFDDIRPPVMEKVVEYLYWRQEYLKTCNPALVEDFDIDDDVALDLLKASTLFNLHE